METRMLKRAAVGAAAAVSLLAVAVPAAHAQTPPCAFVLGFAAMRTRVGAERVGACLESQRYTADGNAEQRTSGGLLVWRKADNWTAFTDGARTWITGPGSVLVDRPNDERYPWESDAGAPGATLVPLPPPPPAPAALAPGTELGLPGAGRTLTVTALSVERLPGRGAFGPLVKVAVKLEPGTNTQHVGAYDYWDFRLRNAQGVEFQPSVYDHTRPGALGTGSLRGGQFVVGDLYFEVPAGASDYGLHFYPSGDTSPRVAVGRWLGTVA